MVTSWKCVQALWRLMFSKSLEEVSTFRWHASLSRANEPRRTRRRGRKEEEEEGAAAFLLWGAFNVKSDYWMAASPFHGSSGRLRRWLPRPRIVQVFTPLTPVGIKASIRTSFALSPLPNKAGLRSKRRFNWAHRPDWKRADTATGAPTKHPSKAFVSDTTGHARVFIIIAWSIVFFFFCGLYFVTWNRDKSAWILRIFYRLYFFSESRIRRNRKNICLECAQASWKKACFNDCVWSV